MAGTYRQKTVIAICSSKSFERLDLSRDTGASVKYLEDVKVPPIYVSYHGHFLNRNFAVRWRIQRSSPRHFGNILDNNRVRARHLRNLFTQRPQIP